MQYKPILLSIIVLLLAAFVPVQAQVQKAAHITSDFEFVQDEYGASDKIIIRFTFANTSNEDIYFLKWNTPFEGFNADMFEVKFEDELVLYLGKLIKRAAPTPDDYLVLAANSAKTVEIDLAEGYSIYKKGAYNISYSSILLDTRRDKVQSVSLKPKLSASLLQSGVKSFTLTEEKPVPKLGVQSLEERAAKGVKFHNCSQSQQSDLNLAVAEAESYALGAWMVLAAVKDANDRQKADRYIHWFGTPTAARWDKVSNNFEKIYNAIRNQTLDFYCDCESNSYAYVYPSDPYKIYLCKAFWTAPMTGTDSKAGVIIHEMSHFYVVAGTKDHVYGQTACANLAQTDPNKAVENADSHEYFAENTPQRSMGLNLIMAMMAIITIMSLIYIVVHMRRRRLNTPR